MEQARSRRDIFDTANTSSHPQAAGIPPARAQLLRQHWEPVRTALSPWLPLFRPLVRLLARGQPVDPDELAAVTEQPAETVAAMLAQMPDLEYDAAGKILGYGVTLVPTPYQVLVDGVRLFAWCALDTLMVPLLLDRPVHIRASCQVTGTGISITATPEGIKQAEPPGVVMSLTVPPRSLTQVRTSFCRTVHFFASDDVATRWLTSHPGHIALPVDEAFALARFLVALRSPDAEGTSTVCCDQERAEQHGTASCG